MNRNTFNCMLCFNISTTQLFNEALNLVSREKLSRRNSIEIKCLPNAAKCRGNYRHKNVYDSQIQEFKVNCDKKQQIHSSIRRCVSLIKNWKMCRTNKKPNAK